MTSLNRDARIAGLLYLTLLTAPLRLIYLEALKKGLVENRSISPDWNEEVLDMVAEGDNVVSRFLSTGTQKGVSLAKLLPGSQSAAYAGACNIVTGTRFRLLSSFGEPQPDWAAKVPVKNLQAAKQHGMPDRRP